MVRLTITTQLCGSPAYLKLFNKVLESKDAIKKISTEYREMKWGNIIQSMQKHIVLHMYAWKIEVHKSNKHSQEYKNSLSFDSYYSVRHATLHWCLVGKRSIKLKLKQITFEFPGSLTTNTDLKWNIVEIIYNQLSQIWAITVQLILPIGIPQSPMRSCATYKWILVCSFCLAGVLLKIIFVVDTDKFGGNKNKRNVCKGGIRW